MRYKEIIENMDHSKDGRAVEELRAALEAHKDKLQDATDDQVYNIIDKIMTRIARSHSITGQELHDMWVDKYKQIPDTWIMNEAFDQPYKTKSEKSDYGDVDMLAKLPDGSNLSIMFNQEYGDEGEEVVQVQFYRNNSQEVTGEGDAQRIFATVLDAIQKYIKKYKPQRLSFSASKETDPTIYYGPDDVVPNPESRAKLYDRLVQRYARAWGYRAFRADNGDIVIYELSRLGRGLAEADELKEDTSGIDFDMEFDDDTGSFVTVTARAHGRVLGSVKFFMDGDHLEADMVEVDERYRGQGIAAAMYDYAKSQGYTIEKSSDLTPDGDHFWNKNRGEEPVWENNTAAGINKMFNNLGDPVFANLQRVALLAMQGRQQEAAGRLQTVIKGADPAVQKKIIDAVNNIKPVTINGRVADSSTLDKSKQHNDWIINTFIPWVQSLLGQTVAENFHDGKNPQDKGDSKRHGVPTKASISTLRKVAKQGGRKGQLAHWMANMKSGRAKAKRK